jgi:hypothetical protein
MAKPRSTKLRTFTESGSEPDVARSRARSRKPPANVISSRKAAARNSRGGGKLPRRIRDDLEERRTAVRTHPTKPAKGSPAQTRSGKREPRGGRHDQAAEMRDVKPSRRAASR